MVTTPQTRARKRTKPAKLEGTKASSQFLRQPLADELPEDAPCVSKDAFQILKFHGSYQQDNRDNRQKGQDKDYQFMLRTRSPGGFIPAQLYRTLDELADGYGNGTLRVTDRQGFQLHGILKQNLKTAIASIVRNMGSTLGACGDLNRNVMAPPAPFQDRPEYRYAREYAHNIADLLRPQSGAYYEIWLDGEKAISAEEAPEVKAARQRDGNGTIFPDKEEPIYGEHYMPRKFKTCVTVPGDNSIDVYTHDLALVVITDERGELQGFDVLVGGGMGRTYGKEATFPRAGEPLGYIDRADVYDLVKAVVATQRDFGDRADRSHARMKYLIHDWGIERFRQTVERYLGKPLQAWQPLPEFRYRDYLGWHEQGDGKLFLGLPVENGRIKDEGQLQLKTALRQAVDRYELPLRLTPNHNVLLCDIDPSERSAIDALFRQHGTPTDPGEIDPLLRYSMACPAMPTCGLAITESERVLPGVIDRVRTLLHKLALDDEAIAIRMTGCPNGCARPYMAELGLVGNTPGTYEIWLGGTPDQTQLAQPYQDKVPERELDSTLEPILAYFKQARRAGEGFGPFCNRVGFEAIRQFAATYTPVAAPAEEVVRAQRHPCLANGGSRRHRISVRDEVHARLKAAAARQGKSMAALANEALEAYLPSKGNLT